MLARFAVVALLLPALVGCAGFKAPDVRPHVTPRGVVIWNFHPAPAAQQQQREPVRPPWWPRNRP